MMLREEIHSSQALSRFELFVPMRMGVVLFAIVRKLLPKQREGPLQVGPTFVGTSLSPRTYEDDIGRWLCSIWYRIGLKIESALRGMCGHNSPRKSISRGSASCSDSTGNLFEARSSKRLKYKSVDGAFDPSCSLFTHHNESVSCLARSWMLLLNLSAGRTAA
jgi:hypothetical protein